MTPAEELKTAADVIARMEALLVAPMAARGHEGTARIYRGGDGKWAVRLRAKRGAPFRNFLGTSEYAFAKNSDDLGEVFRDALRQAHERREPGRLLRVVRGRGDGR
jgi:hypothetical protein